MDISDPLFWVAALLAGGFVGFSKGGWPAVGMMSVPIMSLVMNPILAAGLLAPVYVFSDIFGMWAYRREFDKRVLVILIPAGLAGTVIGWATATIVSEAVVTGIVGLIGLGFSLNLIIRRSYNGPPRQPRVGPGLFWGALAGFTSFVSHAGAPPYQVYTLPLGMTKAVFAGTTTMFFAVLNLSKLVPYWFLGTLAFENLSVTAVICAPALVAVFLGVWLVRRVPTDFFFRFVAIALFLVSLKLIWDAGIGLFAG